MKKKQIEEKCQEEKKCNIALLSRHHQKQRTPPSNARRKKETMCKQHSGPTVQYKVQYQDQNSTLSSETEQKVESY